MKHLIQIALIVVACASVSQGNAGAGTAARAVPPLRSATRQSEAILRGHTIRYTVTATESPISITPGASRPDATMFSVSYLRQSDNPAARPVMFVFNGGPGSSASGLHDAFAPKKVVSRNPDMAVRSVGTYVDNNGSPLDETDLVFIDPPGTGYGREFTAGAVRHFSSVRDDAKVMADFMARWLEQHGRRGSPKLIAAESYGGIRLGLVAAELGRRTRPILFDGYLLISPSTLAVEDDEKARGFIANAVGALPSLAAAAAYYHKGAYSTLPADELQRKAVAFAQGRYRAALERKERLSPVDRARVADDVSAFTGVPSAQIDRSSLVVPIDAFVKLLLADRAERIGLGDSRAHALLALTGKAPPPYDDPSTSRWTMNFSWDDAIDGYFRNAVGYPVTSTYVRYSGAVYDSWRWNALPAEQRIAPILMAQINRDRSSALLALGYYDLIIPYGLPLHDYRAAAGGSQRLTVRLFAAGHAVFNDVTAQREAGEALRNLIDQSITNHAARLAARKRL